MLVELQVDNSKNEILPGSYATVRVPQVALGKLVTLPDNTLIFREKSRASWRRGCQRRRATPRRKSRTGLRRSIRNPERRY